MKPFLLLFLICLCCFSELSAQRRTTSVKGYYRKDGTYVSPHTRSYESSSGYISSYTPSIPTSGYSSKAANAQIKKAEKKISHLNLSPLDRRYLIKSYSTYSTLEKEGIISTQLLVIYDTISVGNPSEILSEDSLHHSTIYVSVLRYNGVPLDVCPIAREYSGEWDFNKVQHRFLKSRIKPEEALLLVSDFGWELNGDEIKKNLAYDFIANRGYPPFLTKSFEAIKLAPR